VLTGQGVTAWRRAVARLTCATTSSTTRTRPPVTGPPVTGPPPEPVTTELIHALAGLTAALAGT
jgi:hypothetical protein